MTGDAVIGDPVSEVHQYLSSAWLDSVRRIVEDAVANAGDDLSLKPFSMCEIITGVPPEVPCDDGTISWHCRLEDGKAQVGFGRLEQSDVTVLADYATILPIARSVMGSDSDEARSARRLMIKATKDGKLQVQGDQSQFPPALASLHDAIAIVTA